MPFSQIIPPSPSPTESKRLFYTSVSLLLSCIQGYCYHLSKFHIYAFSSVQFSRSVVSDSLKPRESLHSRPPCPSPAPGVHSDSRPSQWCHPSVSSSVVPFSSCPQSLPASESFPMSQPVLVFFFLAYFTLYNRLRFHPPHYNWFKCILILLNWSSLEHNCKWTI